MLVKEKINEIFMPSLKHRALVKITIALWNRSDITDLMTRSSPRFLLYHFTKFTKEWQGIQDKITGKVPKLKLPEPLKKEVVNLIQPIGLEILKWKKYQEDFPVLSTELCWTPQGTVDQKKTAEILIKNESVDITDRYMLACNYCLEDDVKELWNSLPQRMKDELYNGDPYLSGSLSLFWTYLLKGELTKFNNLNKNIAKREISLYQLQFEYSASFGNKAATEYFLKKLTPRERNESLIKITDNYDDFLIENKAEILCFSLSQMNEEQQVKIFEKVPSEVLSCLLEWPWQNVFMEAANCTWDFLSEECFKNVLEMIVDKIMSGYTDWNYHEIFGEFWQQSPNSYKKYIIGGCASRFLLLSKLFQIEDKGNIGLILRDATVKEREDIIFHIEGKNICRDLIYKNKWDLLKFFVQECISSEDSMIKFKGEFTHTISRSSMRRTEGVKDLWTKFFEFLDELIHKDNK